MRGTFTHPTSGSDRDRPQRLAPSTPSDVPPSAPSPCITASHPRLGAGNAVAAGLANLPPTSALDLSHHARPAQARPCRAIRTGSPVSGDTDRVAVCPPDEGPVRSAPKIICDTRKCAPGPFKPRLSVGAIRDPRSHAQHGAATAAVPIDSKFATPIPSGAIRAPAPARPRRPGADFHLRPPAHGPRPCEPRSWSSHGPLRRCMSRYGAGDDGSEHCSEPWHWQIDAVTHDFVHWAVQSAVEETEGGGGERRRRRGGGGH